jgi:hypothetical protein
VVLAGCATSPRHGTARPAPSSTGRAAVTAAPTGGRASSSAGALTRPAHVVVVVFDLPAAGYRGCVAGRYAAKHNPWVDFGNVPAAANQPYTSWPADFSQLPTVAFVIPNLCNDMHDCGVATGDAWARAHLDPYLRWADTHASRLVVTFDENDGSRGNQIATLIAGASVRTAVHSEPIDHYALLRSIDDWFGLPPIGNAATATPISNLG